ncbi:OmpA family protein [Cytophagaceae bacterium ABcell3]|nr:OmpA family protein [Cytophagaceae bacterium ABcell3]
MLIHRWLKCLFLLVSFSFLLSENALSQSARSLKKEAKQAFKLAEYHDALQIYLKLDSFKPDNPFYLARIGTCYLFGSPKTKAAAYFEKARSLGYKGDELDLYQAKAYHFSHQFEKAIALYEKALSKFDPEKEEGDVAMIERNIQMCRTGIELVRDSLNVEIHNLGPVINSRYPEYAPVISVDEQTLIFTSRRPGTTGNSKDVMTDQYFEDIYISHKDSSGAWGEPQNIGGNINTGGHDACIGMSPDGQMLFIYKDVGMGDIYYSTLKGAEWSKPKKMGGIINTPKSWEPSASITADEKTIFFTSDRKGGHGGTDIYMAVKDDDGSWGPPKNLGPTINTPFDEDAPFIHPDGKTLYFSSRGHNTMGGYDIFVSEYFAEADSFSAPVNIGYPINTADDDIFFVWSADGSRGYFSSVREEGYGDKDLYVVHRPKPKVSLIVLKGKVFSEETAKPVGADITVTDNETNEVVNQFNANSHTGKYTVIVPPGKNYGVSIEAAGYLHFSENIFIPEKEDYHELVKDFYLEPISEGSRIVLKNVFFDSDKYVLKNSSHAELDRIAKLLINEPDVFVEIAGHTDNIGNEAYNQELSEKRAASVVDYLVSKGIEKHRMVPIGYGEKFPVATNQDEEGRQQNRRTEMIVIEDPKKAEGGKGYYYSLPKE